MSAQYTQNHPVDTGHTSTGMAKSGLRKWLAVISATGIMAAVSLAVAMLLPTSLASAQDAGTPVVQVTDHEDDHAFDHTNHNDNHEDDHAFDHTNHNH